MFICRIMHLHLKFITVMLCKCADDTWPHVAAGIIYRLENEAKWCLWVKMCFQGLLINYQWKTNCMWKCVSSWLKFSFDPPPQNIAKVLQLLLLWCRLPWVVTFPNCIAVNADVIKCMGYVWNFRVFCSHLICISMVCIQ